MHNKTSVVVPVQEERPSQRAADADETGFKPIFNGKTLDGWAADPQRWTVKDETIVGAPAKEAAQPTTEYCQWRRGTVDDFYLRLSFRYTGDFDRTIVEIPVVLFADAAHGVINPRAPVPEGKPIHFAVEGGSAELRKNFRDSDWNELQVWRRGSAVMLKLNGQQLRTPLPREAAPPAVESFVAMQLPTGAGAGVEFKDIRLKRLRLKDRKKVVMVAGTPSHGPGEHEFNAGSLLLKKCLDENAPQVQAVVYMNGWPGDPTAFDNADAIMLYMDGGGQHPVVGYNRLAEIDYLMKQGVGLICATTPWR